MFTPAYARVQQTLDQGDCLAAVYEWENNFILQPFIRRGQSLTSFYGGGGPVYSGMGAWITPGPQLWLWFEQEFAKWRKENKITKEYVRLHPLFEKQQRALLRESSVKFEQVREAVVVNIDYNDDNLLNRFSRNRIRGVYDAIEAGIRIATAKSTAAFAHLYRKSLRRLNASEDWFYPDAVWETYRSELGINYHTILMAAAGDGDLWPQLLILHAYGKAYAHFLASDHPVPGINDFLYYESMKYCRDVGCKTYFLGGGTTSDPADSLLAYKSGFSKDRTLIFCYKREFNYDNADSPEKLTA